MLVINDIECTIYQSCTKYRTHIGLRLTKKDELIKTKHTLRKQMNQWQSNIETQTANLQRLENKIKKNQKQKP